MADMKVVCIGNPLIHKFLSEHYVQWDWQIPVESIEQFDDYLNNDVIDDESTIVFVHDQLYDETGANTAFEKFIAYLSPYAMVAIVNYRPEHKGRMQDSISNMASRNGYHSDIYHFISKEDPFKSIDEAISTHIQQSNNEDIVEVLSDGEAIIDLSSYADESEADDYVGAKQFLTDNEKIGKVIAVTSSKGGSGKSTVGISLASYIARASIQSKRENLEKESLKVAIVDLDIRDGQLGFLTGHHSPTVVGLLLEDNFHPETVKKYAIAADGLKADLFLAPKSGRAADDIPPEWYNEFIQVLRTMYHYIILDTSVHYLDPLLEKVAYPSADQILLVTDLGVNSVFGMSRWIKEVTEGPLGIEGSGVSKNKIGIIVNKSMDGIGMSPQKIKQASLGLPVIAVLPSMPKLVTMAANKLALEELTNNPELNKNIRRMASAAVGKGYDLSILKPN